VDVLRISVSDSSANAHDVVEDFIDRFEAVIALKHDGCGRLARENVVEEI
jgi:hypothetical protein